MSKKTILHGEAMITEVDGLPKGVEVLKVGSELIIADSETTGNHHVVENAEGCEFYMLDGIRYMKNDKETSVKCVHENRHDTLTIPPGTWEFGVQKEYDYFSASHRAVQD
jgi:hypothetical protein